MNQSNGAHGKDEALAIIPVAISARHVHLTVATVAKLFGETHGLHVHTPLSQPGQFAAAETVTLVGPRGRLAQVRVAAMKSCSGSRLRYANRAGSRARPGYASRALKAPSSSSMG
jgi:hypothetical protein